MLIDPLSGDDNKYQKHNYILLQLEFLQNNLIQQIVSSDWQQLNKIT